MSHEFLGQLLVEPRVTAKATEPNAEQSIQLVQLTHLNLQAHARRRVVHPKQPGRLPLRLQCAVRSRGGRLSNGFLEFRHNVIRWQDTGRRHLEDTLHRSHLIVRPLA